MSKEVLTHSDRYVRKTNRIILIVGIITLFVFLFGLLLLTTEAPEEEQHYEVEDTIDAESNLGLTNTGTDNEAEIEFDDAEEVGRPITLTPNPINMGQVVIGSEASNVLTIGTNGKGAIRILSVDLEEVAFEGFTFESNCNGKELRGKITCTVTMSWKPTVTANVQNNFKITWHETNVSDKNAKHDEVSVYGNAVTKEDCNFCDGVSGTGGVGQNISVQDGKNVRYAIGPDGKIIGTIDENGIVYDANGNEIGRMNADGMIVDRDGNIIGVASTEKMALDANGNVIGYVDGSGIVHDLDGKSVGTVLADGTIVDHDGNILGKAVESGYVYDDNGNIIGRVLEDGSVVDLDGNIIGRVNEKGEVVDKNGNIIGRVAKSGEVAFDENGNRLGVVMPNGNVVNENGDIVGFVDANGNVYQKQKIGKKGAAAQLALDANGNVIGYIDENGDVRDFNGNIIGHVDENGNVVDANGSIIGHVDENGLAVDANGKAIGQVLKDGAVVGVDGKIIGYEDENGNVVDTNGNIIGQVDENGNVVDANGNAIGQVLKDDAVVDAEGKIIGYKDENGNVVDINGNMIGTVSDVWRDLALDENGKVIGYIDEDGLVYNGDSILGYVNEDGSITGNKNGDIYSQPIAGRKGAEAQLALDSNGKSIGYIDENGDVRDFNGNVTGRVDESGNIVDANGNIIGTTGENINLALDKTGNIIGYVNKKNIVYDKTGRIFGIVDKNGNIRVFGESKIGSLLDKMLLPITPDGKVLGEVNNRGEVVYQNKVVGKMRPNGLVTDKSGAKIIAKGIHSGYIVNWGCDFSSKLDKDGIIRKNGEETDMRVFADGTVWTADGRFAGKVIKTGSVYDNECNYIGEAKADGYVWDAYNNRVGCLNPDGAVLGLDSPQIKGHLVEEKIVMSLDWQPLGVLEANGILRQENNEAIGCVNHNGEVYDKDMGYIGSVSNAYYAFDLKGNPLGLFDKTGQISLSGQSGTRLFLKNLIADKNNKIIGFAAPEVNILVDAQGNVLGHLFPDGNVYDNNGTIIDKISGDGLGIYDGNPAKFVTTGYVVGMDGKTLGYVNYDLSIVDITGTIIGKVDAKGKMFDEKDRQIGGIIKQGGVRGYNGSYLGYVVASGDVVELEDDQEDIKANKYQRGDIVGRVTPDGHVIKDENIIGEVLPEAAMVDIFGNYVGFSDAYGLVVGANEQVISALLPGGVTNNNISALPKGIVIDFGGKVIGTVLPDGRFMNEQRAITGNVMADGKVASQDGQLLGEVVNGDIVIGNDDNVKGFVGFDGKVYKNGIAIGRILTDGLAVDTQKNVLGHVYNIGNTILSNDGSYIGRLSANGKVIEDKNREIGYIKSNGSFIDADKNVSGYLLPEVAKNRRN